MGQKCQNCQAHLSDAFVRVFYPEDPEIEMCIFCPEQAKTSFEGDTTA